MIIFQKSKQYLLKVVQPQETPREEASDNKETNFSYWTQIDRLSGKQSKAPRSKLMDELN